MILLLLRKKLVISCFLFTLILAFYIVSSSANASIIENKRALKPTKITTSQLFFKNKQAQAISGAEIIDDTPLRITTRSRDSFSVKKKNMDVKLNKIANEGIFVNDSDTGVSFSMSARTETYTQKDVLDDTIVYRSKDEKTSIGYDVLSCGIRQSIAIENADKPTRVTIDYAAAGADYIGFIYDNNGEKDGSAILYDKNGDPIVGIDVPSAVDKNGVPIQTYYEVNGTELTQVITTTKGSAYPVAATSESYSSYFKSSKWITRGKGKYKLSLSIVPKIKACGAVGAYASWPFLKKKHSKSKNWSNTAGLKNQYLCHAITVQNLKTPWNIEPKRPYVSFASTCAQACNPK